MDTTTLAVSALGCVLVLLVRPIGGLIVYVLVTTLYPYYVGTLDLGTIHFSASRIVIIALFVRIFMSPNLIRGFKFIWLDKLVVILFAAEVLAGMATTEPMKLIQYRAGDFFDMSLPYFAVRLVVTSRDRFNALLKSIAWTTAMLAVFAGYESLTGRNLWQFGRVLPELEVRLGMFYRAQTIFSHPIYFGVYCAMAGALCMSLVVNERRNAVLYVVLVFLMFTGSFWSMSSGGVLAMATALVFAILYRFRHMWRVGLVALVVLCVVVEVLSNRHFYSVVDYITFNAKTTWYRARLFEVAFWEGGMTGHWLTGYGFAEPGWGPKIDMRQYTDMVNHYLMELCRYGLVGFIPFCVVIGAAFRRLFAGFSLRKNDPASWTVWCIAGALISVLLAFNSVSLFWQPMTLLFMAFGFCVRVPEIFGTETDMQGQRRS